MNLCSDDRDEICFDGRKCPMCERLAEKDRQIESLEDQVADLKNEINGLSDELKSHQ